MFAYGKRRTSAKYIQKHKLGKNRKPLIEAKPRRRRRKNTHQTCLPKTAASFAASAMVIQTIARSLLPYELKAYIFNNIIKFFKSFSCQTTLIIEEFDGLTSNQTYKAAGIYLGTKICSSMKLCQVSMGEKETKIVVSMAKNQETVDVFYGVKFKVSFRMYGPKYDVSSLVFIRNIRRFWIHICLSCWKNQSV